MMRYLNRFLTAVQFFSRLPVPWQSPFILDDFAASLMYAPLVGLLMGALMAVFSWALSFCLPPMAVASLSLILYILLSGGLHFDGLGDTFDGLGSGQNRERMLEIMRDSRIGSSALLALTAVLLFDFAALSSLPRPTLFSVLLIWPMLGRAGVLIGAADSDYARTEQGLGRALIDYCTWRRASPWLASLPLLCCLLFVVPWQGAFLACGSFLVALVINRFITRAIGGATGDTLGAVVELTQAAILLLALLLA